MKFEQPQSIRTIFLDAGFTLLRPFPSIPEICQQVCRQLDLHLHLDQVKAGAEAAEDFYFRQNKMAKHIWADERAINDFWTSYYTMLLRPFVEEQDEARLYQLASAVNQEFTKHTSWELYPDVLPTLEALQAHGYQLGVISDWGIALSSILHHHKLNRFFDCLLISAASRHAKPSPQLYEMALQRANAIADYTIHIGDSYIYDVLGARSVGITPILLDRSGTLHAQQVDCLLVHSLTGLLDLLEVAQP
ncbi:HAD family hydrolase [Tengunoibacter tsumagoiensis]|uniref:Hydrolase n=1 Tax=Tengunoibacter tsumagoiensis TaxID=2014871 RepID=A0A401ZXB7_9CHLR|nr:HAD hydrolase-like protein [Tengunoibacter tsumagoiensis]GCE11489.1 hypothetical protein KTT_13480 [Tengunoibacter tsumagoiensis]